MSSVQKFCNNDAVSQGEYQKMFQATVRKYQNMIYRTALTITGNREDAEDILQEVFLKYFRLRPEFENESHEKAWFLRVAINEGKNQRKNFWNSRRSDFDFDTLIQPDADERDSVVLQAVMHLPEKYRVAIYLYYYEAYAIQEIAKLTGQTESTVAQQLSRGRKKLRKELEG